MSVAVLAVLTAVLLIATLILSAALCLAICRFRERNLTYTIKNPEAKESKYWIEAKPSPSEGKVSPIRAEEGEKVWYSESAAAFPVFPMAHLTANKDQADSNLSVQTFRLARAFKQSTGNNIVRSPPVATSTVSPSEPPIKVDTEKASNGTNEKASNGTNEKASNGTNDGAVVDGRAGSEEAVARAIVIPTTPTSDSDLSKTKKRRPPPLKPVGSPHAEPEEGTHSKQGGSSQNPTTPGSCSVHKGQVYTDPRSQLMKEYTSILQGRHNQNTS